MINKYFNKAIYFQDIKALTVYSMIILIIAPRSFSSNNHYKNIISQPMIIPLAAIYIAMIAAAFGWDKFKNMRFLPALPTSKLQMLITKIIAVLTAIWIPLIFDYAIRLLTYFNDVEKYKAINITFHDINLFLLSQLTLAFIVVTIALLFQGLVGNSILALILSFVWVPYSAITPIMLSDLLYNKVKFISEIFAYLLIRPLRFIELLMLKGPLNKFSLNIICLLLIIIAMWIAIIWLFKNNTVEDYDKTFTVKFSEVVFKICIAIFISIAVMTIIGMILTVSKGKGSYINLLTESNKLVINLIGVIVLPISYRIQGRLINRYNNK
ncbi:putative membrane protein [Clostridium argentinense CDC 2741]|uniref:Putative membrane protein n=1 Tax=Clostridium argentinense CDC 2741 TaxID=1418104 RepID=A0A0C1QU35_9CLOT|nr:hypothetical protein [Clostridium argentinense]ARC84011.1 hypothetical protein RSJ17_05455 [Clostridium argentinense]KIE44472.1 putative membrane protein [Clostridium argentinense CDC 2741]NFF39383.1 hypothetical protein [Clostridium argentinense]NFP50412.1 hypothetical protein [Clostridium argentinense]NFP73364.1 hypothetical protein [Clostridium argentinense]